MSDDEEAKYSMDAPGMSVSTSPQGLASAANPYNVNFDKLKLSRTNSQAGGVDYVFPEQHGETTYDWSAAMFFGTGVAYIGGSGVGGLWGLREGLRRPEGKFSTGMRINSILNACGRRGPQVGNKLGIAAFLYTFTDGAIIKMRGGENDIGNKIGAGALAGATFFSTSGPKRAAQGALFGAIVAGLGTMVHAVGGTFVDSVYEPEYR